MKTSIKKNPATYHKEKIAVDTVKSPIKALYLGGPCLVEAVEILKELGYSDKQINKLKNG